MQPAEASPAPTVLCSVSGACVSGAAQQLIVTLFVAGSGSFEEYDLPPALPIMGMIDYSQDNKYALGSQKKNVTGEVLRWHHEHGTVSVAAADYIERLENENRILKQQVC